jgi:hypothetical protein
MEKLTITRVGPEKDVETKYGTKKKQGVWFKEYGEVWHDVWGGGLKEGQILEGTRKSRDYQGKTYWNFELPKKENPNQKVLEDIQNKLTFHGIYLKEIVEWIRKSEQPKVVDYPTPESVDIDIDKDF